MYYLLSLLSGILVSAMVALNGGLTEKYGTYSATVIIHLIGLFLISALLVIHRDLPFRRRCTRPLYLGGAIGVATTIFNNMAFGRISISAILALGLFAQSIMGLIVDHYGLMGMPVYPFRKNKVLGLFLILGGIAAMTDKIDLCAVILSLLAGVNLVISRSLNARLAAATSIRISTFYNYLIGFLVSFPVCMLLGYNETAMRGFVFVPEAYIYLGGILGVCVVLLSNLIVIKVSAFYLALFLFIGQVASGIIIDAFLSQAFSPRNLMGGLLVAAGLCANLILDKRNGETGKRQE